MIGIILVAIVIATVPFFSFAKAAGMADQRLEELHNALIFKEDKAYEGKKEN